jgi:hypothetical protein
VTEIPDAAIEAVMDHFDGAATHDESEAAVIAALPHLRPAILANLRGRVERAIVFKQSGADSYTGPCREKSSYESEVRGLRLALPYIGDAERGLG